MFTHSLFIYVQVNKTPNTVSSATVGQVYMKEFQGDLYRAQVMKVSGTQVSVLYPDWGNSEDGEMSSLLPIPQHIAVLPAAVSCCLPHSHSLQTNNNNNSSWIYRAHISH